MTEIEKKTGMTDAECEYWDDYFTNNPYEPGPNLLELGIKPGFAHKALLLNELDKGSPAPVINNLVHETLSA